MRTSFSRSHTLASVPKFFLKTPNVPGPQTSWVMRTSTFAHTFSPGATWSFPEARARIFSVIVMGEGISRNSGCDIVADPGREPGGCAGGRVSTSSYRPRSSGGHERAGFDPEIAGELAD